MVELAVVEEHMRVRVRGNGERPLTDTSAYQRPRLALTVPEADPPVAQVVRWARVQVHSTTPGAAEAFMRMAFDIDLRHVAPAINVPTLIIHATGDGVCHVENARFLSRAIPRARHVELPATTTSPRSGPTTRSPEIYVPQHLRKHGYYTMPVLRGGRIVAVADPALDRARTLKVNAIHLRPA